MARQFISASNQAGALTTSPVGAYPLTVAMWVKPTRVTGASQNVFEIFESTPSTNKNNIGFAIVGSSSQFEYYVTDNASGAFNPLVMTPTLTAGTWYFTGYVVAGATSRTGYLNTTSQLDTVSAALTSTNPTIDLGKFEGGSTTMDATVAEIGVWSAALTPGEMGALAGGVLPCNIRQQSLVIYWPMWGLSSPEPDMAGNGRNLVLSGSPAYATHAPVSLFTPRWPQMISPPAAAPSPDTLGMNIIRVRQPGWQW